MTTQAEAATQERDGQDEPTGSFSLESPDLSRDRHFDRLALTHLIHMALREWTGEDIVSDDHMIGLRVHFRGRVYQVTPEEER